MRKMHASVIMMLGLLFICAYVAVLPAEDAVILYEYSKNLANTGVVTYSTHTFPIEGATDFLWMILISLGSYAGLDEFASAQILSALSVMGLFYVLCRAGVAPWLIVLSLVATPYLYATLFGFSALFFAFFYVCALYFLKIRHHYFYWALLCLSLVRPDGVVWSAGLLLYHVFYTREVAIKQLLRYFILPYLLYWGWRTWYFGELWPLPFIVKGFDNHEPWLFYSYSLMCIALVIQPIFFSIFFFTSKKQLFKAASLLFLLPCFFYGVMRLEQNVGNRLLAPMFWGWIFYIGQQDSLRMFKKPMGPFIFVALSILYGSLITLHTAASLLKSKVMNVYTLAKKMDMIPPGRMLVSEAGRLAYYTRWDVDDSWGLNTPFYAHHFVARADLEREHYDLIVTHCDLTLLRDKKRYTQLSEKTWGNQSKILLSYLRFADYDIYLVPYYWGETSLACIRYDVYGISRSFQYRDALRQLLKDRGGLPYSTALHLNEDTVCA